MSLITLILTSVNILITFVKFVALFYLVLYLKKIMLSTFFYIVLSFLTFIVLIVFFQLSIVRQRDKLEPWFNHFLVEDKGLNGSASYVDFLCHIHKEIRNILS